MRGDKKEDMKKEEEGNSEQEKRIGMNAEKDMRKKKSEKRRE